MNPSTQKSEKIFVTSAAGLLGSATIHYLHYNRPEVAIVGSVRNTEKSKDKFTDMQDDLQLISTPDVLSDSGLRQLTMAMKDCDSVFIIPPNKDRVTIGKAYIRAAKDAGTKLICLLSMSAVEKRDVQFAREFGELEEAVRQTNLPACFLRCGFFTDNLLADAGTIKRDHIFYHPANPDARFNPVTTLDVATLAASVLCKQLRKKRWGDFIFSDPKVQVLQVTGPSPISMTDIAGIFTKMLKKDVKYVQYDPSDCVKMLTKPGASPSLGKALFELWAMINDGLDQETSNDYEKWVGKKPTSVEGFLTSHVRVFQ